MRRSTLGIVCGVVALAVVLGVVMVAFSGGGRARRAVVLVEEADCSPSMIGAQPGLPGTAARITADAARPNSLLMAGAFAGDPGRAPTPFPVVHRYGDGNLANGNDPTGGNENLKRERMTLEGRRQGARVSAIFSCAAVPKAQGTPLLSVLALCARTLEDAAASPDADRRVVLYTDGALIGDGLDVRAGISGSALDATIKRFAPRLTGLHGARVWLIGVGSGTTISSETLDQVHALLSTLLDRVGARLAGFDATSAAYPMGS